MSDFRSDPDPQQMPRHDESSELLSDEVAAAPSPRDEIRELIATNEGRLGDVYRLLEEGLSAERIAERLNIATQNFVYTYRYQIDAALDGKTTSGAVLRRQAVSALNSLKKRGRGVLSPEAFRLLQANISAVESGGTEIDPAAEAEADIHEEQSATLTLAELTGLPGIYAFSYGWYLESLVDPDRGNTLIKVGQAADVASRIRQHSSGARTHMPEPLALIRVYSTGTRRLLEVEHTFHDLLESAGHANPRRSGKSSREVGKEWFLTNEDFLDSIAKALGLRTLYIGRSEFAGE
ncbi:GIY-YIG nuclease family protein [Cryobacterium sp. Hb1]|uniref:GIY-YIG nuclease family protein n=1 Tax=Cryobacterium sp. Hb1 TaxID=1259147 RepID=UPI00106BC713|nr:GIY-YIG nuclease family protein [Cryobacterium sp. Hb1]TFD63726.1 GIY-YIG nuclease family protein [Cryobacterium sp. Hb1]